MEKLKQESANLTQQNIERIAVLFPSAITETKDADGNLKKAINFTILKQLLSGDVVDGDECYEFTWVGKKQSIIEGNKPIRKTLRPAKDESKNWDTTENLYIEGDNLEVLKMLQNSYLNSIKMIYIDPPYNTGNDFVYRDNFAVSKEDYEEGMGVYDEDENRLFKNTETNGRYHSDWCSMIYPRLQLARNLLTEDGVIFISIDDNEVHNLRKICDEIFGESNFVASLIWRRRKTQANLTKNIAPVHDYIISYCKNSNNLNFNKIPYSESFIKKTFQNPDNDPRGLYQTRPLAQPLTSSNSEYEIMLPNGRKVSAKWSCSKETYIKYLEDNLIYVPSGGDGMPRLKIFLSSSEGMLPNTWLEGLATTEEGSKEIKYLFDNSQPFDFPKPTALISFLLKLNSNSQSIILDFFSGSATTAHAVMQLNAEDGGNRKFIMVQLPEATDEKSEAYKAGYKNICEIGKERIRRAGDKIVETSHAASQKAQEKGASLFDDDATDSIPRIPDIGFRVLKLDSTNMKDVYYSAGDYSQQMLLDLESNIKEDRTDLDLLFGVMLDWGVPLSLPHITETIGSKQVHFVNTTDLVACFDENINEAVVREIATRKPLRVVFRDSSFGSSPEKINVSEIFKTISPDTTIKVI